MVVQIFDLDYPLPKVDLLAVHEFVIFPGLCEERGLTGDGVLVVPWSHGELGTHHLQDDCCVV